MHIYSEDARFGVYITADAFIVDRHNSGDASFCVSTLQHVLLIQIFWRQSVGVVPVMDLKMR